MIIIKPIVIAFIVAFAVCEDWYMPNSHLISDQQFQTYVKEDRSKFKIVKYFSPSCVYCRYLKAIVDVLKAQKQWCFQIYDFNCNWYPGHCMNVARATSYPCTIVYDNDGEVVQRINGYYPEPVIRQIFDKIQNSCLEEKTKRSNSPQKQTPAPSLNSQPSHEPKLSEPIPATHQQIVQVPQRAPETQNELHKVHIAQDDSVSIYTIIFYAIGTLVGAYYFYHIIMSKQDKKHPSPNNNKSTDNLSNSIVGRQISPEQQQLNSKPSLDPFKVEQNDLVNTLPDDQL